MLCNVMVQYILRHVTSYHSMLYYVALYYITECCVSAITVSHETLYSGCRADSSDTWLLRGMMKECISCSSYEECYAMTDDLYSVGSCIASMQSTGQGMIRSDRIISHLLRSIQLA